MATRCSGFFEITEGEKKSDDETVLMSLVHASWQIK
jgi:hypothetical protein